MKIFEMNDKTVRKIRLTKKQWTHINKKHTTVSNYLEQIKETLTKPDAITESEEPDVYLYYKYYTFNGKYIWNVAEIKHVNPLCLARAFEDEIILVYCNVAGEIKNKKYTEKTVGRSQITAPLFGVIKTINHNKEKMFIQEIDTSILKNAETAYKIRKDLKRRF